MIAAAHQLRRLGATRIVLGGASEGANPRGRCPSEARGCSLRAVARALPPGFDVEPAAAKLRVPTLVAVSRDDAYSASDAPDVERHVGAACRARSTFVHTVAGVPPLYVTPFERRIAPPLLVVGSKDDPLIPQRDVARLLAKAPSRAKSSVLVPGSAHGWDLLQGSDASKRVRHAVAQFLANAGAPAATGCSA